MSSLERAADGDEEEERSQRSDVVIPAAVSTVPAAEPVERGRFVLHLHNRDEDSVESENGDNIDDNKNIADNKSTTSAKSFNSDEIFEDVDVEQGEEKITDHDLDRLLGPLPSLHTRRGRLELDGSDSPEGKSHRRHHKSFCPCCPSSVQRGPWQMVMTLMGNDGSIPPTRVGNMIVIFPRCFYRYGCGIMGPHWFGPVCCLGLLTFATIYFAPKAYQNIGMLSAITCLIFYIIGVVSLFIVACSDPGVVKPGGYASVPTMNASAGRGWRYCDLCSVSQPPGAVHCPECNVCVEGYDHHCPWMGTCIGKKNFTAFCTFNATWLFYLMYAIIWVTFFGAAFSEINSTEIDSSNDQEMSGTKAPWEDAP